MIDQLPAPLVAAEVDLRDFAFMPLDVQRLRDSDLASDETPEACWAAVLLWCASWHQVPAASIPDNEQWQAKQAGYVARGRIDAQWAKVSAGALRHWIKCSDGRLYHPVVATKANDAWDSKLRNAFDKMSDRTRKLNKARADGGLPAIKIPSFADWKAGGKVDPIPPEPGEPAGGIPPEKTLKGQGKGEVKKKPPSSPPGGPALPVGLKAWLETVRASGEKPIPPDDAVFVYAEKVGIPPDFLALAWTVFRHTYLGARGAKRYRDWRKVFRNAVEGNWLKLWFLAPDGTYSLTTVGHQAQRAHDDRKAA